MASTEDLYSALAKADAAGDSAGAKVLADHIRSLSAPVSAAPIAPSQPADSKGVLNTAIDAVSSIAPARNKLIKDLAGGAVRGAGSIGATLMTPIDAGARALGIENSFVGRSDRRQAMDESLKSAGVDTDSYAYGSGKLGAEIAGTAGAGGALAKGLSAIPGVAAAAPALIDSIGSAGMAANGLKGATGIGTRMLGGAINGGLTAGMVNPNDAPMGAIIGGVAPPVVQGMAELGKLAGKSQAAKLAEQLKEFNRKAPINETVKNSIEAGYVIPPNMVKPSFGNQVIESISGKQATQQLASLKNSEVTEGLVRKSLGLADDAPLSSGTMENLRKTAGNAYAEVSNLSPQAAVDLEALKTARNEAQGWFKAYNRSARPDDLVKAKDARALSDSLETALETHAQNAGKPELIPSLRDARKQIAKTYTIGRALNDASGSIDARVLGRMSEKGLPLSDGLDVAGKFASAFPTVAKTPEAMGSPAAHNLKAMASALMGGSGFAALGPAGAAAAAVPFVAPPMARALMFREGAQKALIEGAPKGSQAKKLAELLQNPELQQMLLRSAPVTASQGQ